MIIKSGGKVKVIVNGKEIEMPLNTSLDFLEKNLKTNNFKGLKAQVDNNDWPVRDHIPVDRDPIGDVDEKKSVYNKINLPEGWEEEANKFYDELNIRRINPSDMAKKTSLAVCDCGTEATYGKTPIDGHSNYCTLVKNRK